jgi:hypothetical protein
MLLRTLPSVVAATLPRRRNRREASPFSLSHRHEVGVDETRRQDRVQEPYVGRQTRTEGVVELEQDCAQLALGREDYVT